MRHFVRLSLVPILALAASAEARAQASAKCEPSQASPPGIAKAAFFLARANESSKGANPTKDYKDAVGVLADPKNFSANPVATNLMLGQIYTLMLQTPAMPGVTLRRNVGLTSDPEGTIDLYAAIDSAFSVVERTAPECVATTTSWRMQAPWLNVTNAAVNALNAGKVDSAEIYAQQSLRLSKNAPYAFSVLASVAKTRKQDAAASDYWKQTLTAAGTDTSYADVRARAYYEMGSAASDLANAARGEEKKRLSREAIRAWEGYMAVGTTDAQVATAMQNLLKMYVAAGDTVSAPNLYAKVVANPSAFGENSLLQAGVIASRYRRPLDAVKLFGAVLETNPYQRDALNNLAASYIFTDQYDKVSPIVSRLLALDPNNPDNAMLYAYMYSGLLKKTKDMKAKKLYTDSLVYYNDRAEKMPLKVSFSEFMRGDTQTILGGIIENRTKTVKTYSVAVEFLDKTGKVVTTQMVSVGPVAANSSKEFRVTVPTGGITGYRYKPIM